MITIGIGYGLLALICLILAGLYARKVLPILIPALIGILFMLSLHMPDFYGYAVDDKLVFGREATLLQSSESEKWIYLLVQFTDEIEPRLIRMISTEENRKEREEAQERANKGLAIIRFGQQTNGKPGEQGQAAQSGEEGQQLSRGDAEGGGEGSFNLLDFGESETFSKS